VFKGINSGFWALLFFHQIMKYFNIILYLLLPSIFCICEETNCYLLDSLASKFYKEGHLEESLSTYLQLHEECFDFNEIVYNIARIYSLKGEKDSAFLFLDKAIERDSSLTMFHGDHISLLTDCRWEKLAMFQIDKFETKNGIIKYKDIALQLLEMKVKDQAYYFYTEYKYSGNLDSIMYYWKIKAKLNQQNLILLDKIINKIGYPKESDVGYGVNSAAFLIIQHCGDLTTMKKYKLLLEECVQFQECEKSDLALLTDRILIAEGKAQIYGTQLTTDRNTGEIYLQFCEDFENINIRRAKMGLQPIEEYLKLFGEKVEMKTNFNNK
jgi:tetratricopeptide (TPR) repeat protein